MNDATANFNRASDASALGTPFFGPFAADLTGLTSVQASLRSELSGAEINHIFYFRDGTDHPQRLGLITGFRFLQVKESDDFRGDAAGGRFATYNTMAENEFFGGQFGLRGVCRNLLWGADLDFEAKYGVGGNDTYSRQLLFTSPSGQIQGRENGPSRMSQFLEAGFDVSYEVNPGFFLTGGYHLLYIVNVARATDQINYNTAIPVPAAVTNGDMLAHGFTLGARLHWGKRTDPCCKSGCCKPYLVRSGCGSSSYDCK